MSYQGQDAIGFDPLYDVDYQATVTNMGPESVANVNASNNALLRNSPSRQLLILWFVVLALYFVTGIVFRGHLA